MVHEPRKCWVGGVHSPGASLNAHETALLRDRPDLVVPQVSRVGHTAEALAWLTTEWTMRYL